MSPFKQQTESTDSKSPQENDVRKRGFFSRLLLCLRWLLRSLKLFRLRARKRVDAEQDAAEKAGECKIKMASLASTDSASSVEDGDFLEQEVVAEATLRRITGSEVDVEASLPAPSLPESDGSMHGADADEHDAAPEEQDEAARELGTNEEEHDAAPEEHDASSEEQGENSAPLSSSLERALEALPNSAAHAPLPESLTVFFTERVQEIRETESGSTEWAGLLADFADELQMMRAAQSPQGQKLLDLFLSAIREDLGREGGELLDSDEWDPQIQRAVEVVHTGRDGEREQVDRKDSFGLRLRGKLLRKQNVKLTKI